MKALILKTSDYKYKKVKEIKSLNDLAKLSKDYRPKGEWISIIEVNDFGEPYQAGIYCSECGETFGHEANFCPYCGADMRGNGK